MSKSVQVRESIQHLLSGFLNNRPVGDDDDFFDMGASSLSIVQLQIKVEKAVGATVPTAKLMAAPTLAGWISLYNDAISAV